MNAPDKARMDLDGRNRPTLLEAVRARASASGSEIALTFLVNDAGGEATLTYAELDQRARASAAVLQGLADAGERAVLLYPPGIDFVVALFACFYAGVIAVPAYPPGSRVRDRSLQRLRKLLEDATPRLALTMSSLRSETERVLSTDANLAGLQWVCTDTIAEGAEHGYSELEPGANELAFLQYTSGSTSQPRGVMLTHSGLAHNLDTIRRAMSLTARDRIVSWLPPYHDMGLIGSILTPLYIGASLVFMSPVHFLQRPSSWLAAVSRYRGTVTGGPNFAYDLCVQKIPIEARAMLDLSSLEVAFVGAEPVRAHTLDGFAAAFGSSGFNPRAFFPCYGLAEATLYVTGGQRGGGFQARSFDKAAYEQRQAIDVTPGERGSVNLVSCGVSDGSFEVCIVDPDARTPCDERQVGEIWISGPSVARGYWQKPDDDTFQAELLSTSMQGRKFLRTGDLGFFCAGSLYISGRLKDLIIVRGRNHYPEDIEVTVESCHPKIKGGGCAVFSISPGETISEQIAVVAEVLRRTDDAAEIHEMVQAVQKAVANAHEIHVDIVVFIAPGAIPKTSSGKIQRSACRRALLAGELNEFGRNSVGTLTNSAT